MFSQYPHILYKLDASGDSTQDADGNFTAQTMTPSMVSLCREKTDGHGKELMGTDVKLHVYTSVIFLPVSCPDLLYGTIVYVRDSETATADRIRGPVLKFDRGQMHCRLWL